MANLFHEIFHFFTHLDKGIAYTIKKLFTSPGTMQREYVEGYRSKHQKPFSFFFITATLTGLSLYWVNMVVKKIYGDVNMAEGTFFHEYMIFLLLFSLPYLTLLTWITFYRSKYNFAEIGILILYTMPMIFLIVIFANCTRIIFPGFETRIIELPLILLYSAITNINFFRTEPRWKVVLKSMVITSLFFLTVAYIQDRIVELYLSS
ncbi:DUF3667 domain-containing protein [Flavitalea sp.]|nr:DUF3667 domain-containing protein [Flavitalea sp.]